MVEEVSFAVDAMVFENPNKVKLDRCPNRPIGFGAGMHRCPGSFLARMKFETVVTEILARMPDYQVVEDAILPKTGVGLINGWIRMPATCTPAPRSVHS